MLVPPFDDPMVIAGQGTAGREIVEDLAALGLKPDVVVVGASGGGLIAGIALAVKARVPDAKFYTAEPEGFDDTARSFRSGQREGNARMSGTICDALMTKTPGAHHLRDQPQAGRARASPRATRRSAARSRSRSASSSSWSSPAARSGLRRCSPASSTSRARSWSAVLSGGNVDAELFHRLIAA